MGFFFFPPIEFRSSLLRKSPDQSACLCLQALPPGGIYIFASQLHTHLAGRGVRTVLVRGGKELEVVQEDQHFSTDYQVGKAVLTEAAGNLIVLQKHELDGLFFLLQTIRVLRKMVNVLPVSIKLMNEPAEITFRQDFLPFCTAD